MPAEIDRMMYVGEVPWHRQGVQLPMLATAAEAMAAAKLDWRVEVVPLFASTCEAVPSFVPVASSKATVRMDRWPDPGSVLGVVGARYRPIQNADAFTFFDPVVDEKAAVFETAGSLGRGERVWMLAKVPGDLEVVRGDPLEQYLLFTNSHDGTACARMLFTPVRVVCANTLSLALRAAGTRGFNLRHTANVAERAAQATALLGVVRKTFTDLRDRFADFVRVPVNAARIADYTLGVVPMSGDGAVETANVALRGRIVERFEVGAPGEPTEVRGTLWTALNAVSDLVDHHRSVGHDPDVRLAGIFYGMGAALKARAFTVANERYKTWAAA